MAAPTHPANPCPDNAPGTPPYPGMIDRVGVRKSARFTALIARSSGQNHLFRGFMGLTRAELSAQIPMLLAAAGHQQA